MKKSILASAALAALGIAASAQAAVTLTAINKGTPVIGTASAPTTVTGYTAYIIEATSTGLPIGGVDNGSNSTGFSAALVQRATASGGDGAYDTFSVNDTRINSAPSNLNLDSHLLAPVTQTSGTALTANNGGATAVGNYVGQINFGESATNQYAASGSKSAPTLPTNTDAAGFSQSTGKLTGTFGIAASAQATVFDIAYLVVPNGTTTAGSIIVATNDGTQYPLVVNLVTTPEPATLSLAGLGSLSLLARRRRQA